jgi:hypothetical protein
MTVVAAILWLVVVPAFVAYLLILSVILRWSRHRSQS